MSDEELRVMLEAGMTRGLRERFNQACARLAETVEWAERDLNVREHLAQQVLQVMAIHQQRNRVSELVGIALSALAESEHAKPTQREGDA